MQRKRLALLDWNGCLLDDVPHRYAHGPCAIFRHYGLPAPSLLDYTQHITSDFMQWYYSRGIPSSGDKRKDGDELNAILQASMAKAPVPPLFPETVEFLSALRSAGFIQALVSGMEMIEFKRQFRHHRLAKYFSFVRGDVRGKAPVFREILAKHGIDAAAAVGVTDTMSDARELAEAGVRPILIPRGYAQPDYAAVPSMAVADDLKHALQLILSS